MAGFGDQSLNHSANDLLKTLCGIHAAKLAGRERLELPLLDLETSAMPLGERPI